MRLAILLLVVGAAGATRPASAQTEATANALRERVAFDGAAYVDYAVRLATADTTRPGEGGFVLRRGFVTARFAPAEAWEARVRLEADEDDALAVGFNEFWLRREDAFGAGHDVTFGLFPTRAVDVAEDAWTYRHLDRTLLNQLDVLDSREVGIEVRGPLAGPLAYTLAAGNGGGVRPLRRGTHVYATAEGTSGDAFALVTLDVGAFDGTRSLTLGGLVAHTADGQRVGAEGFWDRQTGDERATLAGAGVFWALRFAPRWTFAGRADAAWTEGDRALATVVGVGYTADRVLELLPNVVLAQEAAGARVAVLGRLTAFVRF